MNAKKIERMEVLLRATAELLQKQKRSHFTMDILSETVFYDEAECDGWCLLEEIENLLEVSE